MSCFEAIKPRARFAMIHYLIWISGESLCSWNKSRRHLLLTTKVVMVVEVKR
jgi:hypothetical protein